MANVRPMRDDACDMSDELSTQQGHRKNGTEEEEMTTWEEHASNDSRNNRERSRDVRAEVNETSPSRHDFARYEGRRRYR